jgi:hypothetical protein
MIEFLLILLASAAAPASTADPAKCDAKPFTLSKPAPAAKTASAKDAQAKAEKPKPILKPTCNHPGHAPGHKH